MKKRVAGLLRPMLFIAIVVCILLNTQRIMSNKSQLRLTSAYYKTDERTDIVILGASAITYGLYPMGLWDEYGFTSYNLGSGQQSLAMSYYMLKDALDRNRPELVILDCSRAYRNETASDVYYMHYMADNMPLFSKNRINMIHDLCADYDSEERLALYIPLVKYHKRWKELEITDFEENEKAMAYGAKVSFRAEYNGPYDGFEINTENAVGEYSEEYLRRIIDLCRQNDTEILLITMPLLCRYKVISQRVYEQRVNAAYALEAIAEEEDVNYLNFIDRPELAGLDPLTDTQDGVHINYSGATKMTSYIGNYIHDNYDLKDHRNEKGYESFQKDYEAYLEYLPEVSLKNTTTLDVYLKLLSQIMDDERYTVVITDAGGGKLDPFTDYRDGFAQLGLRTDHEAGYAAVIDSGEITDEIDIYDLKASAVEGLPYQYINDETGIKISLNLNEPAVVISGANYIEDSSGFHIVVYDKKLKDLTDCIGINTSAGEYTIKHYNSLNYRYK